MRGRRFKTQADIERINIVERICNQRIVAKEGRHKWTSKIEAIKNDERFALAA